MPIFPSRRRLARGLPAAALLLLPGSLLLAGCGGTSSSDSARIRVADAATSAGTVNILINNVSANGDMTFFSASPYLYLATGASTFSYTSTLLPTTSLASSNTFVLSSGVFYTAYAIGRPDVATTDKRFMKIVELADSHATPPGGQAAVRVLDAAPDAATSVDVLFNGAAGPAGVAYGTATSYQNVPAGSLSVQVNQAGTSTVVIPATPVAISAGKAYTLIVAEPTSAPTYSVQAIGD